MTDTTEHTTSPLPRGVAIAIEQLLIIAHDVGHERAHRERRGRLPASARFAGAPADVLDNEPDRITESLCALAPMDNLTLRQLTTLRSALAARIAEHIECTRHSLLTNNTLADAERRGIRINTADTMRCSMLDDLDGAARAATDIATLIAYPKAVSVLAVLDAIEAAFTDDTATAHDIAENLFAYHHTLPYGVGPASEFTLLIGHLHRLARMEPNASEETRAALRAGIIAARTAIVQWHVKVTADPSSYRH